MMNYWKIEIPRRDVPMFQKYFTAWTDFGAIARTKILAEENLACVGKVGDTEIIEDMHVALVASTSLSGQPFGIRAEVLDDDDRHVASSPDIRAFNQIYLIHNLPHAGDVLCIELTQAEPESPEMAWQSVGHALVRKLPGKLGELQIQTGQHEGEYDVFFQDPLTREDRMLSVRGGDMNIATREVIPAIISAMSERIRKIQAYMADLTAIQADDKNFKAHDPLKSDPVVVALSATMKYIRQHIDESEIIGLRIKNIKPGEDADSPMVKFSTTSGRTILSKCKITRYDPAEEIE